MARGTTYGQLIEMLRDECATSSASSRSTDQLAYYQRVLNRVYETLSDDYDWPFLRVEKEEATKVIQAGERYYDFPVPMDIEDTIQMWHFYGNVWVPVDYGITMMEYTAMNPETGQAADPILRWQIKDADQFEVWPMPASTGEYDSTTRPITITGPLVRFTGRRRVTKLVNNSDACLMDDHLVVLFTAAEILEKQEDKSAASKLAAANARLWQMRRNVADRRKIRMGMGVPTKDQVRGWPRIRAFPANP